ncbi:MAG: LssY C-terminal domain-containing protein [Pseudomonadota bacterium]|nr:LssY C-terminal domain-containing protein [Pseudomonadota bacterium]
MFRLKPIHLTSIPTMMIALPALWFALAYGGLPHLWSHHERKLMASRTQIVAYTSQDIPGDPINLRLHGDAPAIACAFAHAGWSRAEDVSLRSGIKIGASVLFDRPYPDAPVSPLYVDDRMQDLAFEHAEGKSADKRHHVRFWQVAPNDWLGAATYDRGVGFNLFTLQITHHIGRDVDRDRDLVAALILASGGRADGVMASGVRRDQWHRNGGGDRYRTDGEIRMFQLGSACR